MIGMNPANNQYLTTHSRPWNSAPFSEGFPPSSQSPQYNTAHHNARRVRGSRLNPNHALSNVSRFSHSTPAGPKVAAWDAHRSYSDFDQPGPEHPRLQQLQQETYASPGGGAGDYHVSSALYHPDSRIYPNRREEYRSVPNDYTGSSLNHAQGSGGSSPYDDRIGGQFNAPRRSDSTHYADPVPAVPNFGAPNSVHQIRHRPIQDRSSSYQTSRYSAFPGSNLANGHGEIGRAEDNGGLPSADRPSQVNSNSQLGVRPPVDPPASAPETLSTRGALPVHGAELWSGKIMPPYFDRHPYQTTIGQSVPLPSLVGGPGDTSHSRISPQPPFLDHSAGRRIVNTPETRNYVAEFKPVKQVNRGNDSTSSRPQKNPTQVNDERLAADCGVGKHNRPAEAFACAERERDPDALQIKGVDIRPFLDISGFRDIADSLELGEKRWQALVRAGVFLAGSFVVSNMCGPANASLFKNPRCARDWVTGWSAVSRPLGPKLEPTVPQCFVVPARPTDTVVTHWTHFWYGGTTLIFELLHGLRSCYYRRDDAESSMEPNMTAQEWSLWVGDVTWSFHCMIILLKDDLNEPYFTSIKNAMSRKATPEPTASLSDPMTSSHPSSAHPTLKRPRSLESASETKRAKVSGSDETSGPLAS